MTRFCWGRWCWISDKIAALDDVMLSSENAKQSSLLTLGNCWYLRFAECWRHRTKTFAVAAKRTTLPQTRVTEKFGCWHGGLWIENCSQFIKQKQQQTFHQLQKPFGKLSTYLPLEHSVKLLSVQTYSWQKANVSFPSGQCGVHITLSKR